MSRFDSGFFQGKNLDSYATDVKDSMLESPGWVLQGRILVPRVINLTP